MGDQKDASKATWDRMAAGWESYQDYMWATTGHVGEWLAANVDARPGDTILDLAGGPGENGFLLSDPVGPDGTVIVTDFAPNMVELAARSASSRGLGNVETRILDAENMDLDDDSIDGIICRWGFMLMQDPASALAECRRVLKDGRRIALSVWGPPDRNPWVTVTGMTLVQLGHPPAGDPFGPGGMFSLSDHDTLRGAITAAGFSEVTIEDMPVDWKHESFDTAWEFMTEVAGAIATLVQDLPADEVEVLRQALRANTERYQTDDGLILPGMTVNAWAR